MWSLESRSQPEIGDTGRSEAGLNSNKQTKPKGWEEEAHSMDQEEKRRPRLTGIHKGKSEQVGPKEARKPKKIVTPGGGPLFSLAKAFSVSLCSARASLGPVNTANSDPNPSPPNHPLSAEARQGGARQGGAQLLSSKGLESKAVFWKVQK